MNIIREDADCPIKPEDIDVSGAFWDTIWQNDETEVSAHCLVRFAQERGSWAGFTRAELQAFYNKKHPDKLFHFNKLTPRYIQERDADNHRYAYTTQFVAACYLVSPAT